MIKQEDNCFIKNPSIPTKLFEPLNVLVNNGIQVQERARQARYYTNVTLSELKSESFSIICELLSNNKYIIK